jgi:thiamine-phosphate pyrophosphorylase
MPAKATRLPNCRLFLRLPEGLEPESGRKRIASALGAGDVASLLIPAGLLQLRNAEIAKPVCHAHDVALLLEGDVRSAKSLGADGVHLPADAAAYAAARAVLGDQAIIGVDCGTSRHIAMSLGETGADYIGFSGLKSEAENIIAWWAELFELPSVALDPATEEEARRLASHGADFIRPLDDMWRDEGSAAAFVENYNKILGN